MAVPFEALQSGFPALQSLLVANESGIVPLIFLFRALRANKPCLGH